MPETFSCGQFKLLQGSAPMEIQRVKKSSLFVGTPFAKPVERSGPQGKYYLTGMLTWFSQNFPMFAFDIVALLNGTYRPGMVSSFHGLILGGS
jgi:hypothetical protein